MFGVEFHTYFTVRAPMVSCPVNTGQELALPGPIG